MSSRSGDIGPINLKISLQNGRYSGRTEVAIDVKFGVGASFIELYLYLNLVIVALMVSRR